MTVRFVLGLPKDTDRGLMRMMLWEQERFKDLQILHQAENMNEGKSYEYFADLGRTYPADDPQERPWDYAMKADDDTLINIPQLLERLRPLTPREDLYMVIPIAEMAKFRVVVQIDGIWVQATFCRGI